MAKQDYLRILGVAQRGGRGRPEEGLSQAGDEAITRTAIRVTCRGRSASSRRCNEAYDVLKDDQKRAAYDRFGHAAFENGGGAGRWRRRFRLNFGGGGFADIFDEMFGDFMGGRPRRAAASAGRGADLRTSWRSRWRKPSPARKATVRVPTTRRLRGLHRHRRRGRRRSARPARPARRRQGARPAGLLHDRADLPVLRWRRPGHQGPLQGLPRRRPGAARKTCRSTSRPASRTAPASAWRARARRGCAARRPGDLYIFIAIRRTALPARRRRTSHCRVPLPMTRRRSAARSRCRAVDGGRARVTIPAGTQAGDQFRLRGKGMSVLRSAARGDMYVQAVGRDAAATSTRSSASCCEEFEAEAARTADQPRKRGLLRQGEGFLGRPGALTAAGASQPGWEPPPLRHVEPPTVVLPPKRRSRQAAVRHWSHRTAARPPT